MTRINFTNDIIQCVELSEDTFSHYRSKEALKIKLEIFLLQYTKMKFEIFLCLILHSKHLQNLIGRILYLLRK